MDKIDKIFYINLDRRIDRNIEMISEFENMKISNYERFSAIDDGCNGCMKSHLEILKIGKNRGYKNFIILEDDFQFLLSSDEFNKELDEFFNLGINYRVVMLAYSIQHRNPYPFENGGNLISCVTEASNAAGYMISGDFVDILIKFFEENYILLVATGSHWLYANDQCWKKYQDKDWYHFNRRIGLQRASYSDLGKSFVFRST